MTTHSSILAWKIPGMGEPGGLPSTGSHRVGHDWRDLAKSVTTEATELAQNPLLFSYSVVSNSLRPHGLQVAKLFCPSPSPRACSNSSPLSQWCHSTISSSVVPFSSWLQSFPTSGCFKWIGSLHQVAKVLELQLQHRSFQWIFMNDFL